VDKLCDHGCGRIAVAFSKSSKKWRCENNTMKCPTLKLKQSEIIKDAVNGNNWVTNLSEKELEEWKLDCSVRANGRISKNLPHGCFSKDWYNTPAQISHASEAGAKGGGIRERSGRGKMGTYKGFWCHSSWELAFIIWHIDHNISIIRNTERFSYNFLGKEKKYIPDFIVDGILYEIKGYFTDQVDAKIKSVDKEIKIIDKISIKKYIDYCCNKYNLTPKTLYSLYENTEYISTIV